MKTSTPAISTPAKNQSARALPSRRAALATRLLASFALAISGIAAADPRIDSWFTQHSAQYARIYRTAADEAAGNAVITWSRGQGNQSLPVYAGVREIASSENWVYIRSSGLASYVMGPWYLNAARTQLFPNYPANARVLYRIPRAPTVPATKTLTGLGAIGYFVNGVALFDNRDAFYWNGAAETMGSGLWNRDAYVNESVTFDAGLAHQAGLNHHYHANPIALRHQLGDHVEYDPARNRYSESVGPVTKHSPIVAWVRDGFPIYGPYGYANPNDPQSGLKRMATGYVIRDGRNGTANLAVTGRTTLPAWAARAYQRAATLNTIEHGPQVSSGYPLGRYLEDHDFLGDLGGRMGVDFDLDEYNGRFCVTPEFPQGTYAYFVTITENGVPAFPYNLGRCYFGTPTGSAINAITEPVTTHFVGGANAEVRVDRPSLNQGTVTLTWSAAEGGTYRVESSANGQSWIPTITAVNAVKDRASVTTEAATPNQFFRVVRTAIANHDSN
ncbi:MAG: YHYH protein [Verrucomicrobiota bacterium]